MLKSKLSYLGGFAQNLLAIIGVIAIVYSVFNFPSDKFKSIIEETLQFDAFVKPTCEPLASLDVKYDDGNPAKARLIGITIRADNDIKDVSFRFGDIAYVESWAISSDSLSQSEADKIIKNLPKGAVDSPFIFGNIPRLVANSETTIQLQGVAKKSFDCSMEWFDLSAQNKKIAHLMENDFHQIRGGELGLRGSGDSIYKWLSFILIIVLIALFLSNRLAKTHKKERFRISPRLRK